MIDKIRALFSGSDSGSESADQPKQTRADGAGTVQPGGGVGGTVPIDELLERDQVTRQDMVLEAGLEPEDFMLSVIRDAGGRIPQKDLTETVGWDKTAMSRFLGDLEAEGAIERVRVGRKKVVMLPEAVPDICDSSLPPKDDD